MTIKTFDANRVGGGTFQLKQDPTTGEYTVEEVGFVKLPELKLPEIDQAPFKLPETKPDDPTTDTPVDVGGVQTGGGGSGGGGDNQQDFTGESMFKNIQKQATTFAGQDTGIVSTTTRDRTDINEGAIKVEGLREKEAYDKAVANYNAIAERNRDLAMGKQPLSEEDRLQNKADIDAARNEMDSARKNFESTFETIKAAPVISEDLQKFGPTTTTGATGVPDAIVQGQPALPDENIITKAKDVVSNTKPVQLLGIGIRTAGKLIGNVLEAVTPELTATQKLNNRLFKTRGDLGSSTDPGRIAGNPATDLYAGMNRNSAYGNLERAGNKRIETREATIARKGIKSESNPNGVSQEFVDNTNNMKRQSTEYKAKKRGLDTNNPNEMRNMNTNDGGDKGSDSGKSIVCTAMYQTTGLQDWAKAMKIWYIYQKKYLSIQHQEGYHKLFKPFVKGMHKSNIIKAIGAHFAKHRTQHLKHVMFNSKPSLLGKIYNKVLEPICYWAGRK